MEFHPNSTVILDVYLWNTSGIPLEYRLKILAFFLERRNGAIKFIDDYSSSMVYEARHETTKETELKILTSKQMFQRLAKALAQVPDPKIYAQNQYLNHLVDPIFQRVNRLFVLSFEMKMVKHQIQNIICQN